MAVRTQSARFSTNESPASINRGRGWSVSSAGAWLRAHDFRVPRVDRTENQLRFRQFTPTACKRDSFRTLTEDLPRGVQLVTCDTVED
ncbi:MAG: hypothetical protein V3T24_03875 [Longimicrobiales bacterium]